MSRPVSVSRVRSVAGPLRRAHPASGATWNVQVVRGKMSSKCLWHACRALSAGLLLMVIGASMATIGYYGNTLAVAHEQSGNETIPVKNETKGFHLNNLSYVGPIIMGVGGFIVVAACVMTFEARDSAAKVTPARGTTRAHTRAAILAKPLRRDIPAMLHTVPERVKPKRVTGSAPDLRLYPEAVFIKRSSFRAALSLDGSTRNNESASPSNQKEVSINETTTPLDVHAAEEGPSDQSEGGLDNSQPRRRLLERQTKVLDEAGQGEIQFEEADQNIRNAPPSDLWNWVKPRKKLHRH